MSASMLRACVMLQHKYEYKQPEPEPKSASASASASQPTQAPHKRALRARKPPKPPQPLDLATHGGLTSSELSSNIRAYLKDNNLTGTKVCVWAAHHSAISRATHHSYLSSQEPATTVFATYEGTKKMGIYKHAVGDLCLAHVVAKPNLKLPSLPPGKAVPAPREQEPDKRTKRGG